MKVVNAKLKNEVVRAIDFLENFEGKLDSPKNKWIKGRLISLLEVPTKDIWRRNAGMIIGGPRFGTLFQAIQEIDPDMGPENFLGDPPPSQAHIAMAILDVANRYYGSERAGKAYNELWNRIADNGGFYEDISGSW